MNPQPQPPERRPLHQAEDPASVLRDAEIPYRTTGDENDDDLTSATRRFLRELSERNIPHLLVGALAMLQHVEGRTTRDIDFIIAVSDLDRLPGFILEERNEWFATGTSGPVRIDLLFTENRLFAEVLENHSEPRRLLDVEIRCADPEGIVLLKLFALPSLYRQGRTDRAALYETDILNLLHHDPRDPEILLAKLQPHMPASDISALRDVLADIRKRMNRGSRF